MDQQLRSSGLQLCLSSSSLLWLFPAVTHRLSMENNSWSEKTVELVTLDFLIPNTATKYLKFSRRNGDQFSRRSSPLKDKK